MIAKKIAATNDTTSLVAGGHWRERPLITAPTIDERLSDGAIGDRHWRERSMIAFLKRNQNIISDPYRQSDS